MLKIGAVLGRAVVNEQILELEISSSRSMGWCCPRPGIVPLGPVCPARPGPPALSQVWRTAGTLFRSNPRVWVNRAQTVVCPPNWG